ncbi:DUF1254 domain-containing protein [Halomonas sp. V046]|uniref:DUF1254 domain-containing protein n=1 Tax=Halomonas sp. V046 TaxID=3459611 RepID=UPI0040442698
MMKRKQSLAIGLLSVAFVTTPGAYAQQATSPTSFADLSMPSSEVTPHPGYVKAIARAAYIWAWPMVNMQNRFDAITQAPEPGLLGGILPVGPRGQIGMLHDYLEPSQRFIACPNQDVVYGLGFFQLDEEPVVVQVPEFGDRFWVYAAYDQRTDQFGELGKPYGTKPGFYLLVGPNWDGEAPEGINGVIHSSTSLANIVPRVFMNDTDDDREAIQDLIDQVVVYPLSEFDGDMKTIDWSEAPSIPAPDQGSSGGGETKWVVPEAFFDQLGDVLDDVPPLPGEKAMYAQFQWLLDMAETDPSIKQMIVEEAAIIEEEVITPFFRWENNGKPAGNGWNRSVNNAQWGIDYYNRTGTARSNMFDNRPNETQYYYTDHDEGGEQLRSEKNYEVTFEAGELPPVNGFWSLTIYDENHFFTSNELNRFSLGTKNTDLEYNDDGSLTLQVSSTAPEQGTSNWLPAPEGNFSLYIRAYWGKEGILDGSWQPPAITASP